MPPEEAVLDGVAAAGAAASTVAVSVVPAERWAIGAAAGASSDSAGAPVTAGSSAGRTSLGVSVQRTRVPRPGALTISSVAPMLDARSRMPSTP
jgi:hypothetical protein